jgi:hypothetical protein
MHIFTTDYKCCEDKSGLYSTQSFSTAGVSGVETHQARPVDRLQSVQP